MTRASSCVCRKINGSSESLSVSSRRISPRPSSAWQMRRAALYPLTARVTAELRIGQELGEGIRRMFAGMRRVGFADPIYQQTSGSVLLTLKAVQRLDPKTADSLPPHAGSALSVMQAKGRPMSTGEVADALGISNPPARRALKALREEGLIQWRGKGPRDPRAVWLLEGPLR